MTAYATASTRERRSAPQIGEWISEAFHLFSQQWRAWLGHGLIFTFVAFGPSVLGSVYYVWLVADTLFPAIFNPTAPSAPMSDDAVLAGMAAMYGGYCLGAFLWPYFLGGMTRSALRQLRGETIRAR